MTTPPVMVPLGATRDANHVYGWNDGTNPVRYPIPSVTTVLKAVDKSGPLIGWAKRTVAEIAVAKVDVISEMAKAGGPKAAVDWLKGLPDYQRDRSADMGTRIHFLAEQIVRGFIPEVTPEEEPFVAAYRGFLAKHSPRFLAAEEMIFNLRHDYAGTLDAIAVIDGSVWMLDIKTGTGVYPETALQLAAYANAEFIGRTGIGKKFRIPRPSRFGVIHVRPEGARLIEYHVTNETFRAFLHARGMHAWLTGQAKNVMGAEIAPQENAA